MAAAGGAELATDEKRHSGTNKAVSLHGEQVRRAQVPRQAKRRLSWIFSGAMFGSMVWRHPTVNTELFDAHAVNTALRAPLLRAICGAQDSVCLCHDTADLALQVHPGALNRLHD
jgi:hypothetical protein